ncbi:hypothetical protein VCCP104417_0100, partial [Vibrio cholerae CP1044(17)]
MAKRLCKLSRHEIA